MFTNETRGEARFDIKSVLAKLLGRISRRNSRPVKGFLRPAVGVAAYLVFYWVFQEVGQDFHLLPQEWSWNLAAGLSFGFLLAFGPAYLPAVLFAYLIPLVADGSTGVNAWAVVVFAVGNTALLGFVSYVAHRVAVGRDGDLEYHKRLVIILTLLSTTALVSAFLSTMNWWWFADALLPGTLVEAFLIKTFGNTMGLLLVGPFVLLNSVPLVNKIVERSNPLGSINTGELVQGAAFLHAAVASVVALGIVGVDRFEAYLLLFVPLIAMALRFGLRGLAASFFVVACTKTAMLLLGYTALEGLLIETTILAALLTSLIVGTLATERAQAMDTVRRQAALILVAAHAQREALRTPEQEADLNEALRRLVREVEHATLRRVHNGNDDDPDGSGLSLGQLEELADDADHESENRLAMKDLRE